MPVTPKNVFAAVAGKPQPPQLPEKKEVKPTTVFASKPKTEIAYSSDSFVPYLTTLSSEISAAPTNAFNTPQKPPISLTPAVSSGSKGPSVAFKGATLRKQIALSVSDLKVKFPKLSEEQIYSVIDKVRATNVQSGSYEGLSDWGTPIQRRLSALLDAELVLIQSSELEKAKEEIAAVITRIERFNSILAEKEQTIATRIFGIFNNPKKEFDSKYAELKAVVASLDSKLPKLRAMAQKIRESQEEADVVEYGIEVYIAGAQCLIEYINTHEDVTGKQSAIGSQIQLLEGRVLSLTSSATTLVASNTQRSLIKATVDKIIECIQDVLLVELPAWRASYIAILTLDSSDSSYQQKLIDFTNNQATMISKLKV